MLRFRAVELASRRSVSYRAISYLMPWSFEETGLAQSLRHDLFLSRPDHVLSYGLIGYPPLSLIPVHLHHLHPLNLNYFLFRPLFISLLSQLCHTLCQRVGPLECDGAARKRSWALDHLRHCLRAPHALRRLARQVHALPRRSRPRFLAFLPNPYSFVLYSECECVFADSVPSLCAHPGDGLWLRGAVLDFLGALLARPTRYLPRFSPFPHLVHPYSLISHLV